MAAQQGPSPAPGNGRASRQRPPTDGDRGGQTRRRFLPRWRAFTWVILAFNLLMLIWIIAGVSSGARNCEGLTDDALMNCQVENVGTGIGAGLIILLWALGDIILGVLWLITKPHKRHCPVCGNSVRIGMTRCRSCGYDFRQMSPQAPTGQDLVTNHPPPPSWPKQPPG